MPIEGVTETGGHPPSATVSPCTPCIVTMPSTSIGTGSRPRFCTSAFPTVQFDKHLRLTKGALLPHAAQSCNLWQPESLHASSLNPWPDEGQRVTPTSHRCANSVRFTFVARAFLVASFCSSRLPGPRRVTMLGTLSCSESQLCVTCCWSAFA